MWDSSVTFWMCFLGMMSTWMAAFGLMSLKAYTRLSSYTGVLWIFFSRILQKMQSSCRHILFSSGLFVALATR